MWRGGGGGRENLFFHIDWVRCLSMCACVRACERVCVLVCVCVCMCGCITLAIDWVRCLSSLDDANLLSIAGAWVAQILSGQACDFFCANLVGQGGREGRSKLRRQCVAGRGFSVSLVVGFVGR